MSEKALTFASVNRTRKCVTLAVLKTATVTGCLNGFRGEGAMNCIPCI